MFADFALYGPAVDIGNDYWRLITSGFLHSGILHIGFNMYILYWLGTMLEPSLGHVRFLALYMTSLVCGLVRRAAAVAQRGDGRCVGRGLRADGGGLRDAARARDRPDAVRPRPDHPVQPRALLHHPEHLDRRAPRRPHRRRGRGAGDGPVGAGGAAASRCRWRRAWPSGSWRRWRRWRSRGARRASAGSLPHGCRSRLYAVVEIPKGSSNKYEWDDEIGAIKLDRLLFSSLGYPTDYGFFKETLASDGDPLDA